MREEAGGGGATGTGIIVIVIQRGQKQCKNHTHKHEKGSVAGENGGEPGVKMMERKRRNQEPGRRL